MLAPIVFAIYMFIIDIDEEVDSYMNFFADDAKPLRKFSAENDCKALPQDLGKLWKWKQKWEMDFNINKYQYNQV